MKIPDRANPTTSNVTAYALKTEEGVNGDGLGELQPTLKRSAVTLHSPQTQLLWEEKLIRWWSSQRSYPLFLFLVSRLVLIVLTYVVLVFLSPGHEAHRLAAVPLHNMILSWDQWDVHWYLGIAQGGYAFKSPIDSAYFPMTPIAISIAGKILNPVLGQYAYLAGGMLVSNAAFLGAMFVLYRYVLQDYGETIARYSLLYLVFYPKALFTFTAYSESLFLLFAILSYVCMRRERFLWAGILGAMATATRFYGIVLVVPFVIELARRYRFDVQQWLRNAWPITFIPAAMIAYGIYLGIAIGTPFGFFHAESLFHRRFLEPAQTLFLTIKSLPHLPFGSTLGGDSAVDLFIAILELALLIVASFPEIRKRWGIPLSLLAFGYLTWLIPVSTPAGDTIASTSRYLLANFPIFIIAARITEHRPRLHEFVLIASISFMMIFAAAFVLGFYII